MIHSLHHFVLANTPACITVASLITGLSLGALIYGRRHEQRTRDRGNVL